jgi:NTE family protein
MNIVELDAPRLADEDHTGDIDFTPTGIAARWQAGYDDAKTVLERKPWQIEVDPMIDVAVHGREDALAV